MLKKLLIAAVIVVILAIIGAFAAYYYAVEEPAPETGGEERSVIDFFFPFGASEGESTERREPRATSTPGETGEPAVFRQVSRAPVAGAVVFARERESGERERVIRYIERATGHVFETTTETPTSERLANTTLPRIQEAQWAPDGSYLLIRYLDEGGGAIRTFYAVASSTASGEGELAGEFLPGDIDELALRSDGGRLLAHFEEAGGSRLVAMNPDGSEAVEVRTAPSAAWNISWLARDAIAYLAEPSRDAFGFLYLLDPRTGSFKKVLGEEAAGLTAALGPAARWVLASESRGEGFRSFVYEREEGGRSELAVRTLPEKCAWSSRRGDVVYCGVPRQIPAGRYPDSWYQGAVSFSDDIWRINLAENVAELLYSPEGPIDAVNLSLAPDDTHLLLTDKRTGRLYALDLRER